MNPSHRKRAQAYIARVRRIIRCSQCGRQPVEWHKTEHAEKGGHKNRISQLGVRGVSIARIKREMRASEALCRSCHMRADGRTAALSQNHPRRKGMVIVPPKPCIVCGQLAKPTRKGKCGRCYDADRRRNLEP